MGKSAALSEQLRREHDAIITERRKHLITPALTLARKLCVVGKVQFRPLLIIYSVIRRYDAKQKAGK